MYTFLDKFTNIVVYQILLKLGRLEVLLNFIDYVNNDIFVVAFIVHRKRKEENGKYFLEAQLFIHNIYKIN